MELRQSKNPEDIEKRIIFLLQKWDFPQLQLFDFVDFEDCHQRMSNKNLSMLKF